jgi:hypothetical protein
MFGKTCIVGLLVASVASSSAFVPSLGGRPSSGLSVSSVVAETVKSAPGGTDYGKTLEKMQSESKKRIDDMYADIQKKSDASLESTFTKIEKDTADLISDLKK